MLDAVLFGFDLSLHDKCGPFIARVTRTLLFVRVFACSYFRMRACARVRVRACVFRSTPKQSASHSLLLY